MPETYGGIAELKNPYPQQVEYVPLPQEGDLQRYGSQYLQQLEYLSVGNGDEVFRADRDGIYLGAGDFASAPFRVSTLGALFASSATLTGAVTATSGAFGGWLISSGDIIGNGTGIISTAASGQRVVINGISNRIDFYASDGNIAGQLRGLLADTFRYLQLTGATGFVIGSFGAGGSEILWAPNIKPNATADTVDIGTAGEEFRSMYLGTSLVFAFGGSIGYSHPTTSAYVPVFNLNGTSGIEITHSMHPSTDNAKALGTVDNRYSDLRSVLINGADVGFENEWYLTEGYKIGIREEGIALVDTEGTLRLFASDKGVYVPGGQVKNLDELPYVRTTIEQRKKMDKDYKKRNRGEGSGAVLSLPKVSSASIGGGTYKQEYLRKEGKK
jgi:hypothetical protein